MDVHIRTKWSTLQCNTTLNIVEIKDVGNSACNFGIREMGHSS